MVLPFLNARTKERNPINILCREEQYFDRPDASGAQRFFLSIFERLRVSVSRIVCSKSSWLYLKFQNVGLDFSKQKKLEMGSAFIKNESWRFFYVSPRNNGYIIAEGCFQIWAGPHFCAIFGSLLHSSSNCLVPLLICD